MPGLLSPKAAHAGDGASHSPSLARHRLQTSAEAFLLLPVVYMKLVNIFFRPWWDKIGKRRTSGVQHQNIFTVEQQICR